MTKLRIRGTSGEAGTAIEPHVPGLYANPRATLLGVVELEHVERTVPGPVSETEPSVTVRISQIEVPGAAHQDDVRELMRALWLTRTVPGTFDEVEGRVQLDDAKAKIAGAAAVIMAGDAIDARYMLRQVREHLSILGSAGAVTDRAKIVKRINSLHDMVDAFLQTGTRNPNLGQEEFDLRTSSGVWTSEGRVDTRTGELAGQDVGTRVPAPAAVPDAEDDGPRDPSEPDHEAPEVTA